MSHLTVEQRYTIKVMLKSRFRQSQIAQAIDKDKSVVSREISRNGDKRSGQYRSELAQRKYKKRQKLKPKHIQFTSSVQKRVETLLKEDYSPEQIVGVLEKKEEPTVSIERIYLHIWADKKRGGALYKHFRNQGGRYKNRGNKKDNRVIIKDKINIDNRPKIVETRSRFGDLEMDRIIGKRHKQAILTICDRASGMLKMRKVMSKRSQEVSRAIADELEDWMLYIKTITADNGKEFANHHYVAESLNIDHYFAHPVTLERGGMRI